MDFYSWKQLAWRRKLKRKYRQNLKRNISHAYEMRHNPTVGEEQAWELIKNEVKHNFIIYRQSCVLGYILDFYCPSLKLAIEIDGITHEGRENQDRVRDKNLRAIGITTLRFADDVVINSPTHFVEQVQTVYDVLESRLNATTPNH